jgi:plasmid replication initiation protein
MNFFIFMLVNQDAILLKKGVPKKLIAVQSNALVEARYRLTPSEQRLLLAMVSQIHPDDVDFKEYLILLGDLPSYVGATEKSVYERTSEVCERLTGRVLHIPKIDRRGKPGFLKTGWVSSAEYADGFLRLQFDPKLKPYLLGLKRDFTKTELNVVVNFRSYYTMRIYILIKKHKKMGFFRVYLSDIREMLGIAENEYTEYKRFKSRVINQAKKEFKEKLPHGTFKSDLNFELEEIRENRKIHELGFHIVEQTFQEELKFPLPEECPLLTRLKQYEVTEEEAKRHIKGQGEEAVWKTVEMLEEKIAKKSIQQNPGGYLVKLLREKAGVLRLESEEKQQQKREEREKALEERKRIEEEANRVANEHLLALTECGREEYLRSNAEERELLENGFCSVLPSPVRKEWDAAGGYAENLPERVKRMFFGHVARMVIPEEERSLARYCEQEGISRAILDELKLQGKR